MRTKLPDKCLAPSILSADFADLKKEIEIVSPFSGLIHIDVMDNHFVPNLTIGPCVVKSLSRVSKKPLDCHLMIQNPDTLIKSFAESGANLLSVHIEGNPNLNRTINLIKKEGMAAGIAINSSTPVSMLDEIIFDVDFILVMSVNPGFGGQSFIKNSIGKIRKIKEMILQNGLNVKIEVDGGVCSSNIKVLKEAGCDWFVAGSSVFSEKSPADAAKELSELING
ncbi:MAG: ribulose-phosphate 3-epimerase [Acidobacteria bacterium]|nr:ribulose-phosphate 3-epimerase [Acidobacteriota bacterium]